MSISGSERTFSNVNKLKLLCRLFSSFGFVFFEPALSDNVGAQQGGSLKWRPLVSAWVVILVFGGPAQACCLAFAPSQDSGTLR